MACAISSFTATFVLPFLFLNNPRLVSSSSFYEFGVHRVVRSVNFGIVVLGSDLFLMIANDLLHFCCVALVHNKARCDRFRPVGRSV